MLLTRTLVTLCMTLGAWLVVVTGFKSAVCTVSYAGGRLRASLADRPMQLDQTLKESRQSLLQNAGIILPVLSRTDKATLFMGERVQKQERKGHSGYGVVVLDVPAQPDAVFDVLTQFDRYMEMIPTVRSVQIFSSNEKNTMVSMVFLLEIAVLTHSLSQNFFICIVRPNLA